MKRKHFFLLVVFFINTVTAQKLTHELIDQFMHKGSMTLRTIRKDTVREIAHSIEFPGMMGWLPGKDYSYPIKNIFHLTSSYIPTSDDKSLYIVIMIPDNMNNMNIRVDKIEDDILKGELLIPEFMFYDPANPPTLPPPTYVYISKDSSRLKYSFSKDNLKGTTWEITHVEGCSIDLPFEFTLNDIGEGQTMIKGQASNLTWNLSVTGGYIHLDSGDFSERIIGIKTDNNTINAYSELTQCHFIIKRK